MAICALSTWLGYPSFTCALSRSSAADQRTHTRTRARSRTHTHTHTHSQQPPCKCLCVTFFSWVTVKKQQVGHANYDRSRRKQRRLPVLIQRGCAARLAQAALCSAFSSTCHRKGVFVFLQGHARGAETGKYTGLGKR